MASISFYVGTKVNYDALATKDDNALYFITDTLQIFKGADEYTKSVQIVSELPTSGQLQGVVYANLSDYSLWIYNGSEYVQINKSYVTSIPASPDDTTVPTSKAVADYVTNKIADVVDGRGTFVTDVTYSSGVLSVAKGDEPVTTTLTGVVNNPTYESETRTITLPVFGGDALVIELGKDAFVESGSYNATGNTIDLVLTSGDEVSIPVGTLVDIYTGLATSTAETTVDVNNNISVAVKVSATANNAITIEEDGLYMSLADYYTKAEVDSAVQTVSDKLDTHIADTDVHVTADEKAVWDAKVSSDDLDTAIATAIETAAEDATTKADAALASAKDYADGLTDSLDDRVTTLEGTVTWQTL